MNSIQKVLRKVADRSNGKMRIVDVPNERKPTAESLAKLNREIDSQLERNEVMRNRSYINTNNS